MGTLQSVLILSAILFASSGSNSTAQTRGAATDLGDTTWQLVKFRGSDGTVLVPGDKTKYTIAFDKAGSVSVRIDCNRDHGTWKSAGPNQVKFGPLALTRAMCLSGEPFNDRLPKDWGYVRSYVLNDGHLFLSLKADGGTYEFEPMNGNNRETALSHLPASFTGTLPCADCPGIRYQLDLMPDKTFTSCMTYEERNKRFGDHGHWRLSDDGKMLILEGSDAGAVDQYAVRDANTLRKLDAEGHEIESKLNYNLTRVPKFVPIAACGTSSVQLENTNWRLKQLGDARVKSDPEQEAAYFLLNSETHRVSGSGGCNRLMGSYELSGDRLTFNQMASTMMACTKGMDTEKKFLDALDMVKTWKIAAQQLLLSDTEGKVIARFSAGRVK
jgi:copper homeostasis protein (lipoprotein)